MAGNFGARKTILHQSLPGDRFIRVATLYASAPNSPVGPKLSLEAVSLDSTSTRFNALSYAWHIAILPADQINAGDEAELPDAEVFEIEVNGTALTVTQNLFDGLVQLAQTPRIDTTPLWIDALCINQGDKAERSSQVQLMGDIYSRATKVVIWLDSDDSELAETKYLLDNFAPRMEIYWNSRLFDIVRDRLLEPTIARKLGLSLSFDEWLSKWDGLARFMRRRRYFTRGWIVQEVMLSRDIALLCGSRQLPWEHLLKLCRFLFASGWHLEMAGRLMADKQVFDRDRPPRKLGDELQKLAHIVMSIRKAGVQDPRTQRCCVWCPS